MIEKAVNDLNDKGDVVEGVDIIPDGILKIFESNEKKFSYKI